MLEIDQFSKLGRLEPLCQAYKAHLFANCPAYDFGEAEKKVSRIFGGREQVFILPLVQNLIFLEFFKV